MQKSILSAPKAAKKAKELTIHGDVRIDNYYWLNDKENPDVISYLNAENEYYNEVTKHTKAFQNDLFEEMKARIKEDDESVPYKKNQYFYITKFQKGKQYPIYTRKFQILEAKEEILFDVNELAKEHSYYKLAGLSVSPNNKIVSFGVDVSGNREYVISFKNLETGELFPEKIKNTTGGATWAKDNKTVFYTQNNPKTLRSEKIFKHILGTDASEDVEVYFEADDTFNCFVYKTKSEKYIIIGSHNTVSTEYRFLDATNPEGDFKVIQPRERNLEYSVAHYENDFYILTNKDNATNFKLMKTSVEATEKENWAEVIPNREDVLLEDISIFKEFLFIKKNFGLLCLR